MNEQRYRGWNTVSRLGLSLTVLVTALAADPRTLAPLIAKHPFETPDA